MSALTRFLRNKQQKDEREILYGKENPNGQTGKIYKLVNNISIIGIFVAIALAVVSAFGVMRMSSYLFGCIATIVIICAALLLSLPWVRIYETKGIKKTAIVFLSMIGLCAVLWIICFWIGVGLYNSARSGDISEKTWVNTFQFIRVTLIITLQFMVASVVGDGIVRYQKTMIPFQAITYVSYAYFDLYLTLVLTGVHLSQKGDFNFTGGAFLTNRYAIMFLVLALIYMIVSSAIMKRMQFQRVKNVVDDEYQKSVTEEAVAETMKEKKNDPSEKLTKLKEMLDKELITQEEYDQKRQDILKDL